MDKEVLQLLAHIDQTRATVRDAVAEMPITEVVSLIKTCAAAKLHELDTSAAHLVGLLAVIAILDLRETSSLEDAP